MHHDPFIFAKRDETAMLLMTIVVYASYNLNTMMGGFSYGGFG